MRRTAYLVVLSALCIILLLVSCTSPVKKDIFINISLTGEAENINYSKFSTTPASFHDNIVVNKYKVYLYQNGKIVHQQESTDVSNNTISLHLTTINSGTYTLRVEAFKNTTPIFYGEKVVQLSYGQNNIQLTTYFNKAKLTVNVENQTNGFELTELSIEGTLPATSTNNFVENKTFENKEIYPGVWHIDLEATMTSDSSSIKVTYSPKTYEIYPSEDKVLNFVIKRDDLDVYIDLLTEVELPYLDKVWNMRAERNEDGLKLMWDYNLPATFNIYRRDGDEIEFIGGTTAKYFVDTNPVSSKNYYYVNAMYGGKESGLCELLVDLQSLQVTIVNPTNGATVTGLVMITAEAQANVGVSKVEFYIDGTKVGEDNDSPYQYSWDTSSLTNNSTHTIQAKAYDTAGNVGESSMVTVTVKNPIPQITIVTPTHGETVQGTITIKAEASDDEGISRVDFFINDTLWESLNSAPYEYVWDTVHSVVDGTYTIEAKVTDSSENYNSASINVMVNNGQKAFGGNKYDGAYAIQQTTDGGYIAAGFTTSFGAGDDDVYVLKLDPDGNFEWQKSFGGDFDDLAYSIQKTADGGYIVAGWTYSSGAGGRDAYVLKLNSNGESEWENTFGGSDEDVAHSIQQTSDGGYIVAGWTQSSGAGGLDVYILKLKSNGDLEWQQTFGESSDDWAYAIQKTTDDGYIVAGVTESFGARGDDAYVLKLKSNGDLEWQQTFGGSHTDYAYSVEQTADGGYIVVGYTNSFGAGGYDTYVLKLDSNGKSEWENTFGGSNYDEANSIQQTTDGGYIVAGYTDSFGAGYYDAYVLRLNSSGELEWQKTFGGNGNDYAYSIQQTTDGRYVVAGYTYSFGNTSYCDAYILKLDSNGELHP